MFLYRQACYTTTLQLHTAVASDCPTVNADGTQITCAPFDSFVQVTRFDGTNSFVSQYIPSQIECAPDLEQVGTLTALLTLLLAVAWVAQMMKRPIR